MCFGDLAYLALTLDQMGEDDACFTFWRQPSTILSDTSEKLQPRIHERDGTFLLNFPYAVPEHPTTG